MRKEMLQVSLFVLLALFDLLLRFFLLERSAWLCNRGAFWGVQPPFLLVMFISGLLLIWIGKHAFGEGEKQRLCWLKILFFGGAINFVDRLVFGCVLDYIEWPLGLANIFPYFNLADSMILLGIAGFGWETLVKKEVSVQNSRD